MTISQYEKLWFVQRREGQQKGEKMPTFEEWWTTTKFELGESPKSCAYRAWNAALQSVPSSPPVPICETHKVEGCRECFLGPPNWAELPEPSDAGQPEIWPGIQCLKFASAEDAKRAEKLFNDLTDEVERLKAAARPPAASEERPFGQWTTFEQWWTDAGCKFNDPEIMAVQAFEEGQRQALQSVPSSPPPDIPLCANHAETWFCERNHLPNPQANCVLCAFTKAAAPSDVGQPNDLTETVLFNAALKLVCERMQWSVETPSAYVLGWTKAIVEFVKKHN